jgi:GT2 family glycosyltransferase
MEFGAIAIGRNEGERLRRCLQSLSAATAIVYVDSGSTDGSVQLALDHGADVVDLDTTIPFTAARARNAGFRRIQEIAPNLLYVQFIDGDCELLGNWAEQALSFLEMHADIGVACGRLHERHPEHSIYNWLCEQEWGRPVGEVRACGGIALMRVKAVEAVGGFREDLIAGEEPELCVRLRAGGWRIWRLDSDMGLHDAAMSRFAQWWQRNMRSGYSFANGAYLHGALPERYFVWESLRAWFWGICLPLTLLLAVLLFGFRGWLLLLIYPLHVAQKVVRGRGPLADRVLLAVFNVLGHFPESWGQIKFLRDCLSGRQARLIEYK